jgi:hypothetical protein
VKSEIDKQKKLVHIRFLEEEEICMVNNNCVHLFQFVATKTTGVLATNLGDPISWSGWTPD